MKSTVKVTSVLTTDSVKVISISGFAGDVLEKHKVSESSTLLVQKGSITYRESDKEVKLTAGEGYAIPSEVFHEVECMEEAAIFVVIPIAGKLKFKK